MKLSLTVAFTVALTGFSRLGFSAEDCSGDLSINSEKIWSTPVVETYHATASNFFGLSIVLSLSDHMHGAGQIDYDFCDVVTLAPNYLESECFGDSGLDFARFPFSIRIIEERTSGSTRYRFSAQNGLREGSVTLSGSFDCPH